jgi:hypothetical protein
MNDALISKLKKLLALAGNNPSQQEAEAALSKAQALAIENGIDLALIGSNEDEEAIVRENMEFGQRLPTVNVYVTNVLNKFFNVRIITSGGRYGGRKLIFIGKQSDINTAKYVYTWLSETMVRCWHNYYKANSYTVNIKHKQSYLFGFYNGLISKLESNKKSVESDKLKTEEQKNKYSVAVVNLEKKIQTFIDNEFTNLRSGVTKRISMNKDSYSRGLTDGINCNIAKGGIGNRAVAQLAY